MSDPSSPFDLEVSFYESIPAQNIQLDDFEDHFLKRLRILRAVSSSAALRRKPAQEAVKCAFNAEFEGLKPEEITKLDELSHYALRLAYCQNKSSLEWFVRTECQLMLMRYENLAITKRYRFLLGQDKRFTRISESERIALKQELANVFTSRWDLNSARLVRSDDYKLFYKVPFERVPSLVSQQKVLLKKGYAYVSKSDAGVLLQSEFRAILRKAMNELASLWRTKIMFEEEDRLVPVIASLRSYELQQKQHRLHLESGAGVADLEDLAQRHFPLCMRNSYNKFRQDHYLKHQGRLQLQLFLKGVGLSYEQTYDFFKSQFTQSISVEKFEKEHGYSIRHSYGLEGSRLNYTPYSCSKVISCLPRAGDHAGCPFRTFSCADLNDSLRSMNISSDQVNQIVSKATDKRYVEACKLTLDSRSESVRLQKQADTMDM